MKTKLKVTLLTHTPNPEEIISTAAKLCYSPDGITEIRDNLTPEETEGFIKKLMNMGHHSPIEHISFTFGIVGVSRSLTHQLVRHRVASYSQKSQRYVREGQFEYVVPPEIGKSELLTDTYMYEMHRIQEAYDYIVDGLMRLNGGNEKQAMEDARYVLPNACETKIIATMNARELLNFFKTRCCNRAQWEIRDLATEMLMQVRDIAPTIFKNAGPNCLNKPCPEGSMTCGKIKEVRERFI